MKRKASTVVLTLFFAAASLIVYVWGDAIVNGKPSRANAFPFMAALGWKNNATGKEDFLCGGVLIARNFVLTAAHCVLFEGRLPDIIKIGGNPLRTDFNENHTVKKHFIYPKYENTQAYNDIALLQLNELSLKSAARLWNKSIDIDRVTAIGYGTTQFAGLNSDFLQQVDLTIMPEQDCQKFFKRKRKFRSGLSPSHICAGDPESLRDTCQGDSGGPLLLYDSIVVGITSVGQACSGNPPAIYTRVSSFTDWIEKTLALGKPTSFLTN